MLWFAVLWFAVLWFAVLYLNICGVMVCGVILKHLRCYGLRVMVCGVILKHLWPARQAWGNLGSIPSTKDKSAAAKPGAIWARLLAPKIKRQNTLTGD